MERHDEQQRLAWDVIENAVRAAIRQYLRRVFGSRPGNREIGEDIEAVAVGQTFQEWRRNRLPSIQAYVGYACRAAGYAAAEVLREGDRQRRIHSDRLRYLIRRYGPHLGISQWEGPTRDQRVGLAAWDRRRQPLACPLRIYELEVRPASFVAEALDGQPPHQCDHRWLLLRLLQWLGGPVAFPDLVRVWRSLLGGIRVVSSGNPDGSDASYLVPDRAPTPESMALSRQVARLVWQEIEASRLQLHRAAVLLQLDGLGHLLLECGLVSLEEVWEAVNRDALPDRKLSQEEFRAFWNDPALSDLQIAERFQVTPAQIRHARQAVHRRLIRLLKRAEEPNLPVSD